VNALVVLAPLTLAIVACEILLPGRDFYHYGWFNAGLAALVVASVLAARAPFRAATTARLRIGIAAIAFGAAVAGFAGVVNGLLAPDNRIVVGAPGANVRVDELAGTLAFPLKVAGAGSGPPDVVLNRSGRITAIGAAGSNIGTFVLRQVPRDVVYVDAADRRGASLTITQPNGATFLSPVLLMQQRQKIPQTNLDLPFDAFAVPAAHRNVKAVLFTAQQAAMMHPTAGAQAQAVLFAVDDEYDRPLPGAIAFARDGETVDIGGLHLRAGTLRYPAIELMAVPSLSAVILAAVALGAGILIVLLRKTEVPA
jgi:hypothetical protein